MRFFKNVLAGVAVVLAFTSTSFAAGERGTKEEAIAMAKKAIAYAKANGKEKAFAEVTNQQGQFKDRDLYVFIHDKDGNCVAHGGNPKLVGKNLMEIRDPDGVFIIKEMYEVTKTSGSGWVEHRFMNPALKAVERKSTYFERADGYWYGVGVYRP